jgi:UDP-N-acetylmuramyl pentapeptide synthase
MQRYNARDVIRLLRTPAGRYDLAVGAWRVAWPLARPVAAAYRRTALRPTRVVAVVGSFGKTTTTRAMRAVLGFKPDAPTPYNCLSHLAGGLMRMRPFAAHGVLEVGITLPGQMAVYARLLRPDVTVVTSIGGEHRTSLGTPEVTRQEKSAMVAALPADGWAILNGDDPNAMWMRTCTRARVMTFGRSEGCDVRALDVSMEWPRGTRVAMRTPAGDAEVRTGLLGGPMAYALLAACAVGLSQSIPLAEIVRRLSGLTPARQRLETVPLANGAWLIRDEYKSAEETVHAALDVLAQVSASRKWVILGPLSEPRQPAHAIYREIGERLAGIADGVVFMGAGWRDYRSGALRAGMPSDRMVKVRRAEDAVAWLKARLSPGDVVLVKGGRSTDRSDRVALALMGRTVRCNLAECHLRMGGCDACPMLERTFTPRTCPPRGRLELPVFQP